MPTVDSASVKIVIAPETLVWLAVSTERGKVCSKGFMLTVIKIPLEVVAGAAVDSPSVVLLVVCGVSTVVSRVTDSVVLAVDKVSEEAMILVRCDFASVKSGKGDVSGVDRVPLPPVGLQSMSEVPATMAVVSSSTLQLVTTMSTMV